MVEYLEKPYTILDRPLPWHLRGLSQTATGYGARLTSTRKVRIDGERTERRVYVTCYGNAGSAWIHYHGRRLFLLDYLGREE